MALYIITDGHGSYIRKDDYSGKYVPVRNVSFAEKFEQRCKAANVLKNAISKNIRSGYKIEEIIEQVSIQSGTREKMQKVNKKNETVKIIACEPHSDSQTEKWISGAESLKTFVMDAEQRKNDLVSMLSEVDKEITDIEHYIEFGKFNAYQGWLAFSMLQNRLKRRRKVKDELRIIIELGQCKITSDMMIDINNAIRELKNRKYAPRVLKQLFD